MRKIISLFLVLLMTMSIMPLALAEDATDDYKSPREISADKFDKARERYMKAKDKFAEDREKFQAAKEEFQRLKEDVKDACAEDKESQECKDAEARAFESAKNTLLNAADQAYQNLAQIRSKIESSEDLTETDASARIHEIENAMSDLQVLIGKIGAADTKDELKEYAKELREMWTKFKIKAEVHAARLVHDKLRGIYMRAKHLGDKIECALATVDEQSKESIMAKVDEMNKLLDEAKSHHDKAKELLDASEERSIASAREEMKAAQESVRKAHALLMEILQDVREAGGKVGACRAEEVKTRVAEKKETIKENMKERIENRREKQATTEDSDVEDSDNTADTERSSETA